MLRDLRKLLTMISIVVGGFLFIIWLNQIIQLAGLASQVHPTFGQAVLFLLVGGSIAAIAFPILWFLRMPKALIPPAISDEASHRYYMRQLGKRLATNSVLKENQIFVDASDDKSIEKALQFLQEKANERIQSNAKQVFISTAISQNGRLDSLIVFFAQMRMVWEVSQIFNQRPSLREISYLYVNVLSTALIVSEIDDIEIMEEQIQPVLASVLGSTVVGGSVSNIVTGSNAVASVIINSVLQGSANAYLTLRVGILTKTYCASVAKIEKKGLRKLAAVEAVSMLKTVVNDSTAVVSKAVFQAAKRTGEESYQASKDFVVNTSKSFFDKTKKFSMELIGGTKKE